MNNHLSPEEFVDAIEGALASSRLAHLEQCEACRQEAASLGTLARQVDAATEVPEPSPLFWDHLSRRINEATASDVTPASGWWRAAWRPLLAGGAMIATAALVVMLRGPVAPETAVNPTVATNPVSITSANASEEPIEEGDAAWDLVVAMANELSHEAVHDVLPAGPDTTVLGESMTARERQEFVKLLRQEMGGLE
jgi:hypothetical protein